jgi:hypothetical protein
MELILTEEATNDFTDILLVSTDSRRFLRWEKIFPDFGQDCAHKS